MTRLHANSAGNYVDFSGFSELARRARSQEAGAKDVVARQFEAVLIQQMLTQMRQASVATEDTLLGQAGALYQDLLDKQIALQIAEAGGLGLSDFITDGMDLATGGAPVVATDMERSLRLPSIPSREQGLAAAAETLERVQRSLTALNADPFNEELGFAADADIEPQGVTLDSGTAGTVGTAAFVGSDDFVRRLRGAATRAAHDLGVAPGVLLAQAALESGWGRHVPSDRAGVSSHNLFGIKAGPGWTGPSVEVDTTEYRNGRPVTERARFRAYASYADSFSDYVRFLRDNPRYQKALAKTHSASGFMQGLQQAGYATDPRYAAKVTAVMQGAAFDGLSQPVR